jgi:hypothetical protein
MSSRWERLLDQKPVPVLDHLLDEVSKLFSQALSQWPPPLEELDLDTGAPFAGVVAPDTPRPTAAHYEEAFKLARFELRRELDAIDDYFRNQRWLARELPASDRQLLLFLSRWMVEQLLSLGEATEGRIDRARMLECLDRTERRLRERAT